MISALAGGCGYHFSVSTGQLPGGGHRLIIPLAEQRGAEPWMAVHFTRVLRDEAQRAGLTVVDLGESPILAARLGEAVAVPRGVALFGGNFRAKEQEVAVRIEFTFSDGSQDPRRFVLNDRLSYLSAPDLRGTEANRQLALRRLLDRLARQAVERLSREF